MDREIQNGLEQYLHGQNAKARKKPADADFALRLSQADAATRGEVEDFERTARLLHLLQSPDHEEALQPAAGFYARVMERIEAQRSNSFWSLFLNPQFSARLLMASGALLVLLGVTLATTESDQGLFGTAAPELVEVQPGTEMMEDYGFPNASQPIEAGLVSHSESGHDQMLVQLATYEE